MSQASECLNQPHSLKYCAPGIVDYAKGRLVLSVHPYRCAVEIVDMFGRPRDGSFSFVSWLRQIYGWSAVTIKLSRTTADGRRWPVAGISAIA